MKDLPLFVFEGDKDKTEARKMADAIDDMGGFRTVIRETSDGTIMLRTKGGMPQITVTKKKKPVVATSLEWTETDFAKRQYGALKLTVLNNEMGGFMALVRPITAIEMDDTQYSDTFLFKPFNNVEVS